MKRLHNIYKYTVESSNHNTGRIFEGNRTTRQYWNSFRRHSA